MPGSRSNFPAQAGSLWIQPPPSAQQSRPRDGNPFADSGNPFDYSGIVCSSVIARRINWQSFMEYEKAVMRCVKE